MLLNVRSLNNKIYALTELLLEQAIDLCCVTETWLRDENEPVLADLKREGFNVISCPRANGKKGGGLAFISVAKSFTTRLLKSIQFKTFEILEVLVEGVNENIRFSIIYRTGYLNKDDRSLFFKELNSHLESIISRDNLNIILGDFNIRINNNDNLGMEFLEIMELKNFRQIINHSTHREGGLLDLVFLPLDFSVKNINVIEDKAISDHYPIQFDITLTTVQLPQYHEIKYRNISQINTECFKKDIKEVMRNLLIHSISNTDSLDSFLESINENLLTQINIHAPCTKKRLKITNHIVTNKNILEARRVKRRAENKYRKSRSERDKINLKNTRKNLVKIVERSRNKFFQDKFLKYKNNIKETYRIINQLLDKNNEKIFPSHNNEKDLAGRFAHFYKEKVEKIRTSLSSPKNNMFKDNSHITHLTKFKPVTEEDILTIITNLENKQSVLDPIPCSLFKLCKTELSPLFHKIINASFQLGFFPTHLKISNITPLLKSKRLDSELLNSYRPVNSLTIISKIYEKCALKQLMDHLRINNLYCKLQSAYRPNHSCETALMKIYDDVSKYLSPTTYVVIVFLDFSAAFDTIDHNILIKRLEYDYGIKDKALSWISSYLLNRYYRVKINNTISDPMSLSFGVPQGSILGPIFFSLYIPDIKKIAHSYNLDIHFYADDVQLYLKCNNNTDFTDLIKCLEEIQVWTNNNYLKLNQQKTKILALSSKSYKLNKIQQLEISGQIIKVENSVKNLGFVIDENLNMGQHIKQVCSHGYRMLKSLWKISKRLTDRNIRIQLVHSGILSKVDYCNSLYTFLPKTQTKHLQKLINSSVRFIFHITGKDRMEHITPRLQELHFLPIEYRVKFKICLMVYKSLNNKSPIYIQELIKLREPNQNTFLRIDKDKLILTYTAPAKQDYKNRSFSYAAPKLWNTLPYNIRDSQSVSVFKTNLKTFYFSQWKDES